MTSVPWEADLGLANHTTESIQGHGANLSTTLFQGYTNFSTTFLWLVPSENGSWGTVRPPLQPVAPPRVRDQALAQVEIGVLGLVLALTALGNGFVLCILLRRRKHNAPMHLFMVNLCVADLVVAFFQVLPQLLWDITEHFQGPDILCRSVKYLQIVGMFASSYMIVAMTVDRHYAICCPLQAYRGGAPSRWNTPIMVAWGLALVLSLPQIFIFSRSEVAPGVFECWGHFAEPWGLKAYVTWMTVAVFILPALIITVCQIRIFREIHDNIYLKSERVVTAEFKRNSVLFHFQQREGHRGRGCVGGGGARDRDGRSSHHFQTEGSCHTRPRRSPSQPSPSPTVPHSNLSTAPPTCSFTSESSAPSLSAADDPASTLTLHRHNPVPEQSLTTLADPSHTLPSNSNCAQSRASSLIRNSDSGGPPELWPDVLPDAATFTLPPLAPPPPMGVSKAMSKTVRMTLVIVLVYTVCWSPFFIVQLWAAWDPNPPDQGVAFTILMLLASLNSCTNPWIYTAFSSSVSREFLALLRCHAHPPRRGSLPDDSTTTHTSTTTKDSIY